MKDLIQVGREMRQAQKNYFSTRLKRWLIKSKELEKQFDTLIENAENKLPS